MKILKERKVSKVYTSAYKCDNCHKIIDYDETTEKEDIPNGWDTIEGQHFDWGNDSADSLKVVDVCSPECYFKELFKMYKYFKNYPSAIIDNKTLSFVKSIIEFVEPLIKKQ